AFAGAAPGGFTPAVDDDLAPGVAVTGSGSEWLRRNLRAIERRLQFTVDARPYPPAARGSGRRGTTVVAFRLSPGGRASHIRVVRSSGHDVLDRYAVEAVAITPRFPRPPVEQDVEIAFVFRIVG
ncbi:MAG TPA: TonB family protein, partial [Anaeromyxobacteraceae bacterium]|nr:TonB family protein [Anaeromyxobacteraceae bacterium]